jgi:hypothetical protein
MSFLIQFTAEPSGLICQLLFRKFQPKSARLPQETHTCYQSLLTGQPDRDQFRLFAQDAGKPDFASIRFIRVQVGPW